MGNNNMGAVMNQGMGGGNNMPQNPMQGGGPGPMRQNRQNDRQQNRNTPYKAQQNNGNRGGGNFQRRSNDGNGMGGNSNSGMSRFDNNMSMDNRPAGGMNNFDRGMNSNNMMDRRSGGGGGGGGFDNDNNFGGFGEDRRGFALPAFPNDMGQNNFGNNDRQNNSGMGNRRNNGKMEPTGSDAHKIKLFFHPQDLHSNSAITTTTTTWDPADRTSSEGRNRTWAVVAVETPTWAPPIPATTCSADEDKRRVADRTVEDKTPAGSATTTAGTSAVHKTLTKG